MAASVQSETPVKSLQSLTWRDEWASIAIRNNLAEILRNVPELKPIDISSTSLPPVSSAIVDAQAEHSEKKKFKVGIVGGGCAGLFTAMIFDHLKATYQLDVDYDILESNTEARFGGRLFSYYFKNVDKPGKHDYYDVGAMRFPDINIMDRTFQLFENLGMGKLDEKPGDYRNDVPRGQLRRYYLKGENTPLLYNDVQLISSSDESAKSFRITGIPEEDAEKTAEELWGPQIKTFTEKYPTRKFPTEPKEVEAYLADAKKFWDDLMERADKYTVRQWLSSEAKYNYNTIEMLETLNFGNRWYDQSFSESILEELDFNPKPDPSNPNAEIKWWCVEGGSSEITNNMRKRVQAHGRDVTFNKRVTAMSLVDIGKPNESVSLSVDGEASPRTYDAVFNSAPLGSMQRMDLTGLYLNWGTKQAIRSLGYGASCKVGVRFRNLWWQDAPFHITAGGAAKTDLPIRCCVYPSYNLADRPKRAPGEPPQPTPGVLLVSYTWSQEAQRIAALINRNSPEGESQLKATLLHDLARLHTPTDRPSPTFDQVYKIIADAYETHHAYDWSADPHTTGAFAYFGPQQFQNMYPWIVRNTGKHIIIGEAASAHHAWVVGALESAVRGVYQFLVRHRASSAAARRAQEAYEGESVRPPFGPLPAEFDRVQDVKYPPLDVRGKVAAVVAAGAGTGTGTGTEVDGGEGTTQGQPTAAAIGAWAREQLLLEQIRMQDQDGRDQIDSNRIVLEQLAPIVKAAVGAAEV